MKDSHSTCTLCSQPIRVIIRGKGKTEKLCLACLVAHYPVLRELKQVM